MNREHGLFGHPHHHQIEKVKGGKGKPILVKVKIITFNLDKERD